MNSPQHDASRPAAGGPVSQPNLGTRYGYSGSWGYQNDGAAHLFHRIDGDWQYITQILPSDPGGLSFGWTLGMGGDTAAISGPFFQTNRGTLYVFNGLSPRDSCDMNCDGTVDASDIEPFIDILFNGARPCDACTGDSNGDGSIDAGDIEGFIHCLFP